MKFTTLVVVVVVVLIAIFIGMAGYGWWTCTNKKKEEETIPKRKSNLKSPLRNRDGGGDAVATPPKRVTFNQTVTYHDAGGTKQDRFNPELHETVLRNSMLAKQVGGAKKLAAKSL
jgi:hypothetical protein